MRPLHPSPFLGRSLESATVSQRIAERVAQRNKWPEFYTPSAVGFLKLSWKHGKTLFNFVGSDSCPTLEKLDEEFEVMQVDYDAIRNFGAKQQPRIQTTWVGHATVLAQMSTGNLTSWNILTDPVFSKHCSPMPDSMGPERYRPPAFASPSELKHQGITIDVVMISHNHYDHLDYPSVVSLAECYPRCIFVVPLGLKDWFSKHVKHAKGRVVELDWHESITITEKTFMEPISSLSVTDVKKNAIKNEPQCFVHSTQPAVETPLKITAVPMCHWSSRQGLDRDKTLWCGFVASTVQESDKEEHKFLFAGDTGYFAACKEEVGKYGPFDVAALPIGAYYPRDLMKPNHMDPFDAVCMMQSVNAKCAIPIHWGTFPLTVEHVLEPRNLLHKALDESGISRDRFNTWKIGQTLGF